MTLEQRIAQLEETNRRLKQELQELRKEKALCFNKGRDSVFNEIDDVSDNSPFYAATINCTDLRIEKVNQIYANLAGSDVTGLKLNHVLHENCRDYFTGMIRKVCESGNSIVSKTEWIQFKIENRISEKKVMDYVFYPVKSEEGKVEKVFMLSFEIEKQMKQKNLLEQILNEVPVGVALHEGPEFVTTVVNESYYKFAHGKGELIGRKVADVWPEVAGQIIPLLKNVYETGEPFLAKDSEFIIDRGDGTGKAWFSFAYLPFRNEENKVSGILVWAIETTQYVLNRIKTAETYNNLQHRTAELEATIDSIPDGYIVYNSNGDIVRINQAAEKILGYSSKEKNMTLEKRVKVLNLQTPEGKPIPPDMIPWRKALNGESISGEIIRIQPKEIVRWLSVSASPIVLPNGERFGAVMELSDVTGIKNTELALRERELTLNAIIDTMPAGVLIADKNGKIVRYNEAAINIWGLPPETESWKSYDNWVGWWPLSGKRIKPDEWAMTRALTRGEVINNELVMNQKFNSNEKRYYLNNAAPLKSADGKLSGGVVVMIDVTERLDAEQKLRRTHSLLNSVTQGTEDMIAAEDKQFRYTYYNEAYSREFKKLWNYEIGIGTSMTDAMAPWPEEQKKARDLWAKALAGESFAITTEFGPADEKKQYYDLRFNPLYDDKGQITGAAHFLRNVTKEVQTRNELDFERERLQSIVDSLSVGLIFFDKNGETVETFNTAAMNLHGFKKMDDFIRNLTDYTKHFELYDANNDPIPVENWVVPNAARGVFLKEWEAKLVQKHNRQTRHISYSAFPIADSQGNMTNILLQMVDVTESKKAEESIRRSEERWNLALENFAESVIIATENEQIIYWNPAARKMHGLKNESEGIGPLHETRQVFELWTPDGNHLLEAHEWPMRRIKRGEKIRNYELQLRRPDQGWEKYVSYSGTIVETMADEKLIFLSVHDLTEQRQSEAALRESEERFRTMADNISQLAWMADPKGRIFWFNKRWYNFTGTALEEVQGWGWKKAIHPDHVERVKQKVQHSLQIRERWEDTFPLRNKSGLYRWFLTRAVPVYDEKGNIVRWFGTSTDVTDQRKAEDLLRKNHDLFENILYIIAHDLKGPIGNMYMALNLIDTVRETEKKIKLLDLFRPLVERIENTIKGVTGIVQVQKGDSPAAVRMYFESLLNDIILENKDKLNPDTIRYNFGNRQSIRYVEPFLVSIMRNLIGNAIKFRRDEVPLSIEVRTEKKGEFILLSISDNGIGIDLKKHSDKLFSPFKRLNPGKVEGTGVGLYIIKSIIEKNGGFIEVESKEGEGTTFNCYLKEYENTRT